MRAQRSRPGISHFRGKVARAVHPKSCCFARSPQKYPSISKSIPIQSLNPSSGDGHHEKGGGSLPPPWLKSCSRRRHESEEQLRRKRGRELRWRRSRFGRQGVLQRRWSRCRRPWWWTGGCCSDARADAEGLGGAAAAPECVQVVHLCRNGVYVLPFGAMPVGVNRTLAYTFPIECSMLFHFQFNVVVISLQKV